MIKYFNIAVSGATPEQERAISAMWQGYGWWHGVQNFWLLRDHSNTMTAASVRDSIRALVPTAKIMVVEVQPTTWAASSMTQSNREWLTKYWPPEGA